MKELKNLNRDMGVFYTSSFNLHVITTYCQKVCVFRYDK